MFPTAPPNSSNCSASANLSAANGETHTYRATYNPANGQLSVWRDGVFALTWTDSTPLTSGNHIAFRTQNSSVRFDNIRATTTTSSLYYFFTDHLGSTSVLSDSSGNEVAGSRTRHLPFGGWRGTAPPQTVTDRAFTGQKENMEVGLLYFNARYYLPNTNRFISADTIVPNPTNPQSFNRYSYTYNNPLKYIDPSGHIACEALPMECQVDSQGNEDWSIGNDNGAEIWQGTAFQVATIAIMQTIAASSPEDLMSGNVEWPSWTDSRLFPDYFTIHVTFLIADFGLTIDDYSNVYFSLGGSFGLELMWAGLSVRAAGGWIIADQKPSTDSTGYEWTWHTDSPTEKELESFLQKWSIGGGVGGGPPPAYLGPGLEGMATVSTTDPISVGLQAGVYTVQAGGGPAYSWLLYDAGSSTPWFYQR